MRRFVIIGGGFAGAACALHFLRDHPYAAAELVVFEPRDVLGAGLAYSTPAREHRTNVAAARLSVIPEEPLHFHNWAHAQGAPLDDPQSEMPDGRLYPSRAVFGRYVGAQLREAASSHRHATLRHIRAMARDVTPRADGFAVRGADGDELHADAVVLAVSHTTPDVPVPLRGVSRFIANPWDVAALNRVKRKARVLIVGSGLTAYDVVATLMRQDHAGPITILSRHGLLPRPRTLKPVEAEGDFTTGPETTALGLLRRVRRAMSVAQAAGRPWENVIDALRQQAVVAWGTLSWDQRRKMLRHLRSFWDVHRFQSAPQIDAVVAQARARGQLRVLAASLVSAEDEADAVALRLRRRGETAVETVQADVVINCTGPGHRSVVATHPVLHQLAEAGLVQPDPINLGILVNARSQVVREDGEAVENLFVAGPLARGTFGELMGLPQVNLQPRAVAAELACLAGGA
jgi:uncharacterized NAD(P)/FAD-binding protein YdhS